MFSLMGLVYLVRMGPKPSNLNPKPLVYGSGVNLGGLGGSVFCFWSWGDLGGNRILDLKLMV